MHYISSICESVGCRHKIFCTSLIVSPIWKNTDDSIKGYVQEVTNQQKYKSCRCRRDMLVTSALDSKTEGSKHEPIPFTITSASFTLCRNFSKHEGVLLFSRIKPLQLFCSSSQRFAFQSRSQAAQKKRKTKQNPHVVKSSEMNTFIWLKRCKSTTVC